VSSLARDIGTHAGLSVRPPRHLLHLQLNSRLSYVCTDGGFTGNCEIYVGASGECVGFDPDFTDDVSSIGPDSGQDCFFFVYVVLSPVVWIRIHNSTCFQSRGRGCSGAVLGPIRDPGIAHLGSTAFNDQLTSFQ
jgi:hypothetical protein